MRAARRLAWLLATATRCEPGDAAEAVRLAEAVALRTGHRDPNALDALAAAYAAQGHREEATLHAAHALRLAQERSDARHADALRARLDLYRDGGRYVER